MKTVYSRRHDAYQMIVPTAGGYRINFAGGRATVPDDVAEAVVALGGGFYTQEAANVWEAGQQVLVIRDKNLGDVLMTTPLIRYLAERGVLVDVQTEERYTCFFDGNPHIRAVLSLEQDAPDHTTYDAVLDLRMLAENAEHHQEYEHRVAAFARSADVELPEGDWGLDYTLLSGEAEAIQERLEQQKLKPGDAPLIGYVWEASVAARSWGKTQHKHVLTALLAASWRVVVLCDTPQDLPVTDPALFNATGQLSLREAAAALSVSDVVITPDTGLFHIASALNKPVVTYFGAWPITERATHTALAVLNAPQKCARIPCRTLHCFNRERDGQPRCLSVPADSVVEAVKSQLDALQNAEAPSGTTAKKRGRGK